MRHGSQRRCVIASADIGWYFPPTNGGREDGFNDPGIATFKGAPISSLARETIQNSLDAKEEIANSVEIEFELIEVEVDAIDGEVLSHTIDACADSAIKDDDADAQRALKIAKNILTKDKVPCLRISDRNTTGLRDKNWHALIKMQGSSQKDGEGAGGSHGIGKYAPFAVSSLRTVFYWTCYAENLGEIERFQGKAVLMSHRDGPSVMQGTGFGGIKQGCSELASGIPERFRLRNSTGALVHGTALIVTGFNESKNWRNRIASSVIENYFYAISTGSLKVIIEPDKELFEINESSLGTWFNSLSDGTASNEIADEDGSALRRAHAFWELSDGSIDPVEKQDQDLGHCKLWIRVGNGLPSRVALVRRTGMLVTDQQMGLMRFPLHQDFAAMCVFEDTRGNELLRRMENAQHDKFEPERLPEEERVRARQALKRITDWIRSEIRKQAGPREGGTTTVLSELAALLPDLQPDEPFDDADNNGNNGTKEPGFGERVTYRLKPIRRSMPSFSEGESENDEGSGEGEGTGGGGGTGANDGEGGTGGSGEGDGEGGTGNRGGAQARKHIPISRVRILPVQGSENRYRISFRSEGTGTVRLNLEEAGDSSTIPLEDIRAADGVTLEKFDLVAGERATLEVVADNPIRNRALRLVAIEATDDED